MSFYLGAARYAPETFATASTQLMAHRMKAKFFNFGEIDAVLFAELGRCVEKALANWDPVAVVAKRSR